MEWQVIETKTHPTVLITSENKKFFLHSKYDPIKEAKIWVDSQLIKKTFQEIVVIGIGLGYHVRLLMEKYPDLIIHVFEFNHSFLNWVIEQDILTELMKNKNIHLYYENNTSHLLNELSERIKTFENNLLIYKPSLQLIENDEVKHSLETFYLKKQTIKDQKELLIKNYTLNIELGDKDISSFLGLYANSTVILVSAGPSLEKQLSLLKRAAEMGIVIASVGTAMSSLIKAGIKPNLIMISDPKDFTIEQLKGLNDLAIPLFYLSTANHEAVKKYKGPRYIVWQKGFSKSESQGRKNYVPLIDTGGSVATCLLDLIMNLGAKKVALVGQDLAFTNNQSHTKGTHLYREIKSTNRLLMVDDYYRKEKIATSRNLFTYLKWFEQYVRHKEDIYFYNCTEGGAYIKGWNHLPLGEFIDLNL